MRKRGARRHHVARSAPGIVAQCVDTRYEFRLRQCVEAFRHGFATGHHHADLADTRDLMLLALDSGLCKPAPDTRTLLDLAGVALCNILDRHRDVGKWGATGDELAALEVLAEHSLDFWNRRSGALYAHAYNALRNVRREQADRAAIAAEQREDIR